MIKCREITDISLVTDMILIYQKNRYLKRRCDTDNIDIDDCIFDASTHL